MSSRPRVTLVHERFTEFAGSEAVVEQLARQWPDAPIFAPVARKGVLPADLEPRLSSTPLSRLLKGTTYAHLLPALPVAMRTAQLPASDVVIASHHAFATQVAVHSKAPVIAYVHSPARWIWDPSMRVGEAGRVGAAGLAAFSAAYKPLDVAAARHVRAFVANSSAVADRIERWWGMRAEVVHPPVDTGYYSPDPDLPREDFFLIAGRLVPYKRPDLAVEAAKKAGVRLVVAGGGRMREQLEAIAGSETTFLGRVSDETMRDLFRRTRALLMPGVEDFGIVPVEAAACGAPVIAVGEGGALDIVKSGVTGELVPPGGDDVTAWAAALADFDPAAYDAGTIRAHAEGFSRRQFRESMAGVVTGVLGR